MIALDTNILIYACDKADPKRQQAALDLVSSASDGVLLWQVACEFVAASRKAEIPGLHDGRRMGPPDGLSGNLSAHPAHSRSA